MSASFSASSALFALVSKTSQRLSVFDARTGTLVKNSRLVHDGSMSPRCVFLGLTRHMKNTLTDGDRILTTGSSPSRRRQLALYSLASFSSPIAVVDVDGASGLLLPFADLDLGLVHVTGKVSVSCFPNSVRAISQCGSSWCPPPLPFCPTSLSASSRSRTRPSRCFRNAWSE